MKPNRNRIPVITYGLIVVNIIVFVIELMMGGFDHTSGAIRYGALYTPLVIGQGEWYRVVTACFLHFGAHHLGMNMISLYAIGPYAELYYGKIRYLIIYMLSGIGGNFLTMLVESMTGRFALSAGASGAICGLMGVLVIFAFIPGLKRIFPARRVLGAVVLMLLPGITDRSISLTAHLGGLISGIIIAGIFQKVFFKHQGD